MIEIGNRREVFRCAPLNFNDGLHPSGLPNWTRVDDSVSMASRGADFLSLAFVRDPAALGGYAVYAATTKGLLVSRDRGSSWRDVPTPAAKR